jgi:biopolymer transport protein ExbB/TolQ
MGKGEAGGEYGERTPSQKQVESLARRDEESCQEAPETGRRIVMLSPILALDINHLDWGTKGFSYALEESHVPGLIVTGALLLLSVISWSVMFSKLAMISQASQKNYRFMFGFRKARTVMEPYEANFSVPGSPLYGVYRTGSRELAIHLTGTLDAEEARRTRLPENGMITPDQMGAVRNAMDRSIGEAVVSLESKMTFLATAVSGAPFLGLLGTVWGVMETFSGVASAGSSANIQSMAPGVAAALVTTVVGLLVAIPAMFGYNFLVSRIRILVLEMHNFTAELTSLFEREFVYYGMAAAPAPVAHDPQMHVPISRPAPVMPPYTEPIPLVPAHAGAGGAAPPIDSFLPTRAPQRPVDGPPINPIAQQAAARRRQQGGE